MRRELANDPAYRAVREESGIAAFLQERACVTRASDPATTSARNVPPAPE
jgi:hypothetical protein